MANNFSVTNTPMDQVTNDWQEGRKSALQSTRSSMQTPSTQVVSVGQTVESLEQSIRAQRSPESEQPKSGTGHSPATQARIAQEPESLQYLPGAQSLSSTQPMMQ